MKLAPALLWLTLVALLVGESHQQFGQRMGPYDMVVTQAYACEDQGNGKSNFSISLYLGDPDAFRKRKRLHKGSISWPFNADEVGRMTIELDAYQKKSSDYLLMYELREELCKTLEQYVEVLFKSFKKNVGIKEDGCVIPIGKYMLNDWEIPLTLPTPMLEYGPYKLIARFLLDKEVFLCATGLVDVKPK